MRARKAEFRHRRCRRRRSIHNRSAEACEVPASCGECFVEARSFFNHDTLSSEPAKPSLCARRIVRRHFPVAPAAPEQRLPSDLANLDTKMYGDRSCKGLQRISGATGWRERSSVQGAFSSTTASFGPADESKRKCANGELL